MNDLGKSPRSRKVGGILETIKQEPCFFDNSNSIESLATMDSDMESPIFFNTPYKIKDPIVLLERCDKIWETMQLIKTMQDTTEGECERLSPRAALQRKTATPEETKSPGTSERYIRYQPVLSNGNDALPNFRFSVKRVKKLYHCNSCGRQFAENRSLRHHSYRVHGIFMPSRYKRSLVKKGEEECKGDIDRNESKQSIKKNLNEEIMKKIGLENTEVESNASTNSYETLATKPYTKRNVEMADEGNAQKELRKKSFATKQKNMKYEKCPLCKRSVKCATTHMINYHKINNPELIFKELGHSPAELDDKKLVKNEVKEEITNDSKSAAKYSRVNSKDFRQKRKLSDSSMTFPTAKKQKANNFQPERQPVSRPRRFDYKRQCKVCLQYYSSSTFEEHLLSHASETGHDTDKPEHENAPQTESFEKGKLLTEESNESSDVYPEGILRRSSRITRSSRGPEEGTDSTCSCGRTFRNPHYLYLHKVHCKVNDEVDPQRQNSSDRDSGIGISITIKKKNDSYEIVGKDSGDENRSKDSGHSKDGDLSSDSSDMTFENFHDVCTSAKKQSEKYSKNHSVIFVKTADEDVNVNIEDDSQHSSSSKSSDINDNLQNKDDIKSRETDNNKNESIDKKTRPERTSNSSQNEKLIKSNESEKCVRKVPTLKYLCQKALANDTILNDIKIHGCVTCHKTFADQKKFTEHTVKCSRDVTETCICGKTFTSVRYLNLHGKKAHPLLQSCPYCKESLRDISAYIEHHCEVLRPAGLIQDEIGCPYCDEILTSSNKFDEHIKHQHFDPILAYQCYKCLKRFPNRPQRLLHFRKEHHSDAYVCGICRKKINGGLRLVHESYHQGLGYPCHQCKKAYPSKNALWRHNMLSHNNTKNEIVTCHVCKKNVNARSFRKHLNVHTKRVDCVICKRDFCNELKLEDHIMKKHSTNYPRVRCNSCGMSFSTKLALQKHIQTEECYKYSKHTMEEEMLCDI